MICRLSLQQEMRGITQRGRCGEKIQTELTIQNNIRALAAPKTIFSDGDIVIKIENSGHL